jgi:hypothetical protein
VVKRESYVEVSPSFSARSRDVKLFTNELVLELEIWCVAHIRILGLAIGISAICHEMRCDITLKSHNGGRRWECCTDETDDQSGVGAEHHMYSCRSIFPRRCPWVPPQSANGVMRSPIMAPEVAVECVRLVQMRPVKG